jgi:hypothetical protein
MTRTVDWHWNSKASGGSWAYTGTFPQGSDLFGVPAGHTIQRVFGSWTAGGVLADLVVGGKYYPLPLQITSRIAVIGEVNGPRDVVVQNGGIWPTLPAQTLPQANVQTYVPYSSCSAQFDINLRVANPSVNQQPIDLEWAWGAFTPEGQVGVDHSQWASGEISIWWTVLTTTPKTIAT